MPSGRHSITPMMAITTRETATSSMLLHALGESARIPKAAPGFSVCTMLKNPPMTGVTSHDVYADRIYIFVIRSITTTAAAMAAVRKRGFIPACP